MRRREEERSWKEGRPSCPEPGVTLMPGSLGKGEHHPQTGAAGCQQRASHPIAALPLPAVGSPRYLGNRGFRSSLQWCCLRWGQRPVPAALPCPPCAPSPAYAAPPSALPQEQGWGGCQAPSPPSRLVLHWVLCAHPVSPAVAAYTVRMGNREPRTKGRYQMIKYSSLL